MSSTIFESATRSAGDLAGVFEHDDDTGYFYLYRMGRTDEEQEIVGAIHVVSDRRPAYTAKDIEIRWNGKEDIVGLFIKGQLWAAFDGATNRKFGGNFTPNQPPNLPDSVLKSFAAM